MYTSMSDADTSCPLPPSRHADQTLPGVRRRLGVVLYDFATKDELVPLQLVDAFEAGVWLAFSIPADRAGVRIRVLQILGDGPVLSAVMFD